MYCNMRWCFCDILTGTASIPDALQLLEPSWTTADARQGPQPPWPSRPRLQDEQGDSLDQRKGLTRWGRGRKFQGADMPRYPAAEASKVCTCFLLEPLSTRERVPPGFVSTAGGWLLHRPIHSGDQRGYAVCLPSACRCRVASCTGDSICSAQAHRAADQG